MRESDHKKQIVKGLNKLLGVNDHLYISAYGILDNKNHITDFSYLKQQFQIGNFLITLEDQISKKQRVNHIMTSLFEEYIGHCIYGNVNITKNKIKFFDKERNESKLSRHAGFWVGQHVKVEGIICDKISYTKSYCLKKVIINNKSFHHLWIQYPHILKIGAYIFLNGKITFYKKKNKYKLGIVSF